MQHRDWPTLFKDLPPGLSFREVAKRLQTPYSATRNALMRAGYSFVDGRPKAQIKRRRFAQETIDWSLPNIEIARMFNVSRQRIHQLRKHLNNVPHV